MSHLTVILLVVVVLQSCRYGVRAQHERPSQVPRSPEARNHHRRLEPLVIASSKAPLYHISPTPSPVYGSLAPPPIYKSYPPQPPPPSTPRKKSPLPPSPEKKSPPPSWPEKKSPPPPSLHPSPRSSVLVGPLPSTPPTSMPHKHKTTSPQKPPPPPPPPRKSLLPPPKKLPPSAPPKKYDEPPTSDKGPSPSSSKKETKNSPPAKKTPPPPSPKPQSTPRKKAPPSPPQKPRKSPPPPGQKKSPTPTKKPEYKSPPPTKKEDSDSKKSPRPPPSKKPSPPPATKREDSHGCSCECSCKCQSKEECGCSCRCSCRQDEPAGSSLDHALSKPSPKHAPPTDALPSQHPIANYTAFSPSSSTAKTVLKNSIPAPAPALAPSASVAESPHKKELDDGGFSLISPGPYIPLTNNSLCTDLLYDSERCTTLFIMVHGYCSAISSESNAHPEFPAQTFPNQLQLAGNAADSSRGTDKDEPSAGDSAYDDRASRCCRSIRAYSRRCEDGREKKAIDGAVASTQETARRYWPFVEHVFCKGYEYCDP